MTKPLNILRVGASLTAGLVHASLDLRILCFGDSLTAGYSRSSSSFHPYGDALKLSLQTAFPSANITMDIQGLSGDQVCSPPGGFLPRMDILCKLLILCPWSPEVLLASGQMYQVIYKTGQLC